MDASIALTAQLETARSATTGKFSVYALTVGSELASRYFMAETHIDYIKTLADKTHARIGPLIEYATPVYVSTEIVDAITGSLDSLPDTVTIGPHDLAASRMFVWLEKPVELAAESWPEYTFEVVGFLMLSPDEDTRQWWVSEARVESPAPNLIVWTIGRAIGKKDGGKFLLQRQQKYDRNYTDIFDWQLWGDDDTIAINTAYSVGRKLFEIQHLEKALLRGTDSNFVDYAYVNSATEQHVKPVDFQQYMRQADIMAYQCRRLAASIILFMNQRIVKISRERVPVSRAERRRLEREHRPVPNPVVEIVKFRPTVYVGGTGSESGRHLKQRHIVRAHWRNQWYPKEQTHKPKLIASYIKGPEGTPVKSATKLFAVVQ